MAKALFGHVGVGTDLRLSAEVRRLRTRVSDLEAALEHAQVVNEALAAQIDVTEELRALAAEPALT